MLPVSGGGNCVGDVSKVGLWKRRFHHFAPHWDGFALLKLFYFQLLVLFRTPQPCQFFWGVKSILTHLSQSQNIRLYSDGSDSKWQERKKDSRRSRKRHLSLFLHFGFSSNNNNKVCIHFSICVANNVESPIWFPTRIQDLDRFPSNVLSYGIHLEADHPGFNDAVYRERRTKIVNVAIKYKQ
jgi:hypothetical protein